MIDRWAARGPTLMQPQIWDSIIGSSPESFCRELYAQKPAWVSGSVSRSDAFFLFRSILDARSVRAVEIGTASGFSTAFICHAMDFAAQAGGSPKSFELYSYDHDTRFYADRSKEVGDACREVLPSNLLNRISFRNPATAVDLRAEQAAQSIDLLFIDANHKHPWPTLDLLAALDALRPGADVLLHDINLPLRAPELSSWGAKHLYDDLDVEKEADPGDDPPNIGKIVMPEDIESFRDQLLKILFRHEWQFDIPEEVTTKALR